ncbi:MAG: single-stranded DNA-binding protein [Acidobacteria bacterium]|nr:single-stranded DNA-binding protein [Acidobacteriota bacterium]
MASMAKVILVGNLGRDAELKYLPNGTPLLEFSIATNEKWTDRSGAQQEHTQWFRITLWGRQAESLKTYLLKGKLVYVDGRLRVRDFVDREGKTRYSLDVRADQVQMLGGGGGVGAGGPRGSEEQAAPAELQGDDPHFSDEDIPF